MSVSLARAREELMSSLQPSLSLPLGLNVRCLMSEARHSTDRSSYRSHPVQTRVVGSNEVSLWVGLGLTG